MGSVSIDGHGGLIIIYRQRSWQMYEIVKMVHLPLISLAHPDILITNYQYKDSQRSLDRSQHP